MLGCLAYDLYDSQRMRPEKVAVWQALRERYGNRDESKVDQGTLGPGLPDPCDKQRAESLSMPQAFYQMQ